VPFELVDQPLRVVDADAELIPRTAQKGAREFAQFTRGCPCEAAQVMAALPIDEAILEVNADCGVGALEEMLNVAEQGRGHG